MKKSSYTKLFSNTIIFAIGSFSSKILTLLLAGIYTRYFTQDQSGIMDYVTQIANWLMPVCMLSINESVIRFGLDKAYNKKHLFTYGNIICFTGFAILGLMAGLFAIISPFKNSVKLLFLSDKNIIFLLFLYVVSANIKLLYSTFLQSLQRFRLFALDSILTALMTLISTIVYVCKLNLGVSGFMLSIITANLCSALFITFTAKLWKFFNFRSLDRGVLQSMLHYSLPMIPAALLWLVTNTSDTFMTTAFLGEAKCGLLSTSYRLPNLIAVVYAMFGQAWNVSSIIENDSDDRSEFYENVFNINQCFLYILCAGCLLMNRWIAMLWFGAEYHDSIGYSPILFHATVLSCFVTFLTTIYRAAKRTKRCMMMSIISGVINISVNLILLPTIGLQGATISTFASYFVVFIVAAIDTRKFVAFNLNIKKMLLNNFLLMLMVLPQIGIRMSDHGRGIISTLINVPLFILILLLNYKSLFEAFQKIIPEKIFAVIRRVNPVQLSAVLLFVSLLCFIGYKTNGWLFYFLFGTLLSLGVQFKNRKFTIVSLLGIFVTATVAHNIGAAGFISALLCLMMLFIRRNKGYVPLIMMTSDICLAVLFGFYITVFTVCAELIVLIILFYHELLEVLTDIIFEGGRKYKKRYKFKKH